MTANELLDSLNLTDAQHFAELMCLPFVHHHEKHHPHLQQNVKKTPSGNSLAKLNTSSTELHPIKGKKTLKIAFKWWLLFDLNQFKKRIKLCLRFRT